VSKKTVQEAVQPMVKKDKAFNFTMKSEITRSSEETNWWAFSEHSGREWKFHTESMCSFPSIPWHQAMLSISHAAVKCKTCNHKYAT